MSVADWKRRNKVSDAEFNLLMAEVFSTYPIQAGAAPSGKSEAYAESVVRLEAPRFGIKLFRNNVGVLEDKFGRPVRYGLANTTKKENEVFKSSDEIGVRCFIITPDMVGKMVGQFTAREIKHPDWKFTGAGRETPQLNFINLINSLGGDACFATGEGSFTPTPKLKEVIKP